MSWQENEAKNEDRILTVGNSMLRHPFMGSGLSMAIYYFAITQISKTTDKDRNPVAEFPTKNLCRFLRTGANGGLSKSRILKAGNELAKATAKVPGDAHSEKIISRINLSKDHFSFVFNSPFKGQLIGMKEGFTKTSILNLLPLKSPGAIAFYMNVRSWTGYPIKDGRHIYTRAEYMDAFGYQKGTYLANGKIKWSLFMRFVVNPALAAINGNDANPKGNTDILISVKPIRRRCSDGVLRTVSFEVSWKRRDNGTIGARSAQQIEKANEDASKDRKRWDEASSLKRAKQEGEEEELGYAAENYEREAEAAQEEPHGVGRNTIEIPEYSEKRIDSSELPTDCLDTTPEYKAREAQFKAKKAAKFRS